MENIAIKGHATRGREVIEILEMLGGGNMHRIDAIRDNYIYFVMYDKNKTICSLKLNQVLPDQFIIYTLEEFEEKFPYKVGDKVTLDDKLCTIIWMCWECNNIYYMVQGIDTMFTKKVTANKLKSYKEETMKEDKKAKGYYTEEPEDSGKTKKIAWFTFWDNDFADEVELNLKDRELVQKDGKWFVVKKNLSQLNLKELERKLDEALEKETTESLNKWMDEETMEERDKAMAPNLVGEDYSGKRFGYKIPRGYEFDCIQNNEIIIKPKYPKTYKECCDVLGLNTMSNDAQGYKAILIIRFQELLIARDAYWKIAGKEMGLDKPWDSVYGCGEWGYWIGYDINANKIYCQDSRILLNNLLVFPTEEMRDTFYENFKDLIEQCKEFL